MAIDERSRHDLFTRLEEILGHDHATILMEHLPPVGWADVATKHDLDQLEGRIDARFDVMETRTDSRFEQLEARLVGRIDAVEAGMGVMEHRLLATFRAELNAQTRVMIFSLVAAMVSMAAVTVTAAGLG